ncbi:MAG: hypothetical protein M0P12_01525 [Paludibacteraceae bacterium]|nr:hypothetical protein [Paludibacteraceae bacterium]
MTNYRKTIILYLFSQMLCLFLPAGQQGVFVTKQDRESIRNLQSRTNDYERAIFTNGTENFSLDDNGISVSNLSLKNLIFPNASVTNFFWGKEIIVDSEGKGNFSTIQGAVDYIDGIHDTNDSIEISVRIVSGNYYENVVVRKKNIIIRGDDRRSKLWGSLTIMDSPTFVSGLYIRSVDGSTPVTYTNIDSSFLGSFHNCYILNAINLDTNTYCFSVANCNVKININNTEIYTANRHSGENAKSILFYMNGPGGGNLEVHSCRLKTSSLDKDNDEILAILDGSSNIQIENSTWMAIHDANPSIIINDNSWVGWYDSACMNDKDLDRHIVITGTSPNKIWYYQKQVGSLKITGNLRLGNEDSPIQLFSDGTNTFQVDVDSVTNKFLTATNGGLTNENDNIALSALSLFADTNRIETLWSKDRTEFRDATGGVWRIYTVISNEFPVVITQHYDSVTLDSTLTNYLKQTELSEEIRNIISGFGYLTNNHENVTLGGVGLGTYEKNSLAASNLFLSGTAIISNKMSIGGTETDSATLTVNDSTGSGNIRIGSFGVGSGYFMEIIDNYINLGSGYSGFSGSLKLNKNGWTETSYLYTDRIGINTNSPYEALHINGNTLVESNITVMGTGEIGGTVLRETGGYAIETTQDGDSRMLYISRKDSSVMPKLRIEGYENGLGIINDQSFTGKASLSLFSSGNIDAWHSLTLNPDGYVGIGLFSPTERLHVRGNALIESNLTASVLYSTSGDLYLQGLNFGPRIINSITNGQQGPITLGAASFGNIGEDTGLRILGTQTGDNWSGRIIAGGPSVVVLLGQYGDRAWLGARTADLNSWENFEINPDGNKKVYLGAYPSQGRPILTIDNATGETTIKGGTVRISNDGIGNGGNLIVDYTNTSSYFSTTNSYGLGPTISNFQLNIFSDGTNTFQKDVNVRNSMFLTTENGGITNGQDNVELGNITANGTNTAEVLRSESGDIYLRGTNFGSRIANGVTNEQDNVEFGAVSVSNFTSIGTVVITNGSVFIQGAENREGHAPLVVQNTSPYSEPWSQYAQVWLTPSGDNLARMRVDGAFLMNGRIDGTHFNADGSQGAGFNYLGGPGLSPHGGVFTTPTWEIDYPALGIMDFNTYGTNRIRIGADGNVVISNNLTVAGTNTAYEIFISNTVHAEDFLLYEDSGFTGNINVVGGIYKNYVDTNTIILIDPNISVYKISVSEPSAFSNNLSRLEMNQRIAEWELWIDFTTTNALYSTFQGFSFQQQPDFTVTGCYKFACSTTDGITVQAKQLYPTIYERETAKILDINGDAFSVGHNLFLKDYFNTDTIGSITIIEDPSKKWILELTLGGNSLGTNSLIWGLGVFRPGFGYSEFKTVITPKDELNLLNYLGTYSQRSYTITIPSVTEIENGDNLIRYVHISASNATDNIFIQKAVIKKMNELEESAFGQGL